MPVRPDRHDLPGTQPPSMKKCVAGGLGPSSSATTNNFVVYNGAACFIGSHKRREIVYCPGHARPRADHWAYPRSAGRRDDHAMFWRGTRCVPGKVPPLLGRNPLLPITAFYRPTCETQDFEVARGRQAAVPISSAWVCPRRDQRRAQVSDASPFGASARVVSASPRAATASHWAPTFLRPCSDRSCRQEADSHR
jgi:hypothetical protein